MLCYKILFGIVEIQAQDFFVPSTYAPTRGHQYKLSKKPHLSRTRANFFSERIVNAWNFLPDTVDFSSISVLNAQSTRSIFLDFLSVLSCYYDIYLMFCTIAIFCVFVCSFSFFLFSKATARACLSLVCLVQHPCL